MRPLVFMQTALFQTTPVEIGTDSHVCKRRLVRRTSRTSRAVLGALPLLLACVDETIQEQPPDDNAPLAVTVTVASDRVLATVPAFAYGMHASVYDNAIQSPALPGLLDEAGITLLRWPGGGYSDNYHWASHSMTAWPPDPDDPTDKPDYGYLAPNTDFGSFVRAVDRAQVEIMITVNYGSNFVDAVDGEPWEPRRARSTGPGEPKEAAAWVAYANGELEDDTVIGTDSVGNDWKTVGYWAGLRASEKLGASSDAASGESDALDFLRIARPEPLNIRYWEVGNEIFGNGYHGSSFNLDLSVPYDGTRRQGNAALSGTAYGKGVTRFVEAMKAVDPTIEIGAVLVTPPDDYSWAPSWNDDVLKQCGDVIDFGIVHWYPNYADLLSAPGRIIAKTVDELRSSFDAHAGARAEEIGIAVTEIGPAPGAPPEHRELSGLFAADSYLTYIEEGVFNIDWLELHNGSFLSGKSELPGPAYHGIHAARLVAGPGDRLVESTSDNPGSVRVHAALGEEGPLRLMLINKGRRRDVEVSLEGLDGANRAQLYRYAPDGAQNGGSDALEGPTQVRIDEPLLLPWRTLAVLVFEND